MTNVRRLLYLSAVVLALLDVAFGKLLGLWAIIIISAEPSFYPTKWSVVVAIVTTVSFGLGVFHILPNGVQVAVISAIACLVIAIANRHAGHRQHIKPSPS